MSNLSCFHPRSLCSFCSFSWNLMHTCQTIEHIRTTYTAWSAWHAKRESECRLKMYRLPRICIVGRHHHHHMKPFDLRWLHEALWRRWQHIPSSGVYERAPAATQQPVKVGQVLALRALKRPDTSIPPVFPCFVPKLSSLTSLRGILQSLKRWWEFALSLRGAGNRSARQMRQSTGSQGSGSHCWQGTIETRSTPTRRIIESLYCYCWSGLTTKLHYWLFCYGGRCLHVSFYICDWWSVQWKTRPLQKLHWVSPMRSYLYMYIYIYIHCCVGVC